MSVQFSVPSLFISDLGIAETTEHAASSRVTRWKKKVIVRLLEFQDELIRS